MVPLQRPVPHPSREAEPLAQDVLAAQRAQAALQGVIRALWVWMDEALKRATAAAPDSFDPHLVLRVHNNRN
jgi:hypothetical protein